MPILKLRLWSMPSLQRPSRAGLPFSLLQPHGHEEREALSPPCPSLTDLSAASAPRRGQGAAPEQQLNGVGRAVLPLQGSSVPSLSSTPQRRRKNPVTAQKTQNHGRFPLKKKKIKLKQVIKKITGSQLAVVLLHLSSAPDVCHHGKNLRQR